VAAAIGGQRDTRRTAYKDYEYDRSARLRRVGPGDMEQPSHRDICKKNSKVISSTASASEDLV